MRTEMQDLARGLIWGLVRGALRLTACWAGCAALALGLAVGPAPATPALADAGLSEELECLALTIYFEARGEPVEGKLAVGYVVMNRTLHPQFPQELPRLNQM